MPDAGILSFYYGKRRPKGAQLLVNLSTLALWQGDAARAHALARTALDIALAVEAHLWEALALVCVGNAELALGHHAAASQACERARGRALEIGHALQYDATAGLARVALASDDPDGALGQLEPVLAHLAGGGKLEGTDWPRLIELTCHQALARAGDARATGLLERIHGSLQARGGHDQRRRAAPQLLEQHPPPSRDRESLASARRGLVGATSGQLSGRERPASKAAEGQLRVGTASLHA